VNQSVVREPSCHHLNKFQRVKLGGHKTVSLLASKSLRKLSYQGEIVPLMSEVAKHPLIDMRALLIQSNPR
jgi:hypothetical protein